MSEAALLIIVSVFLLLFLGLSALMFRRTVKLAEANAKTAEYNALQQRLLGGMTEVLLKQTVGPLSTLANLLPQQLELSQQHTRIGETVLKKMEEIEERLHNHLEGLAEKNQQFLVIEKEKVKFDEERGKFEKDRAEFEKAKKELSELANKIYDDGAKKGVISNRFRMLELD